MTGGGEGGHISQGRIHVVFNGIGKIKLKNVDGFRAPTWYKFWPDNGLVIMVINSSCGNAVGVVIAV